MSLPSILYVSHMKALIGHDDWDEERVRRFMQRNKLACKDVGAKHMTYTTPELIEQHMPAVYRAMCNKWEAMKAGREFNPEDFRDLDDAG